jgi:MOSC domain-containing protein YiiM
LTPTIDAIYIARRAGAPMTAVPHAIAFPGLGLDGDRYATGVGSFSKSPADNELTLIEAETLDLIAAEHGLTLDPGETRRNIVTRGIDLNSLVGIKFKVGEVTLIGTRLCHPCAYLEQITNRPGLARLLANRGGLRAQILTDGVIFEGDEISKV